MIPFPAPLKVPIDASVALQQAEKLQQELTTSTSQLADIQTRYNDQSRELDDVRSKLEISTTELGKWKATGLSSPEEVVVLLTQVKKLQQHLSTSASQFADIQKLYNQQSRDLTTQVEQWKDASTNQEERVAMTFKQMEELNQVFSTSGVQLADLQSHYGELSWALKVVRDEPRMNTLSSASEIVLTVQEAEQLQQDLSSSESRLADLQVRYDEQSRELDALRKSSVISEEPDETPVTRAKDYNGVIRHTTAVDEWLRKDARRAEELSRELERRNKENEELRHKLLHLREIYIHSSGIKGIISSQTTENHQLKQLQQDLFTSESRPAGLQDCYDMQSCELGALEKSSVVSDRLDETVVKDYSTVVSLTNAVDEWLRGDARRTEEFSRGLERRNKENEELRDNLVLLREIYVHSSDTEEIFQHHCQTIETHRYLEAMLEIELADCRAQLKATLESELENCQALLLEATLASELKDRQARLESVRRFVTTADVYADTMIIQMLQRLNAEVQQNTTYIAECIVEPPAGTTTEEQMFAMQRISGCIGRKLADSLKGEDVALFLSIAFQAYVSYHLCGIISSWTIKKENSDFIDAIYKRLQEKEAQKISGRWRSLTRTYITQTCLSDPRPIITSTIAGLSDILVAAGYATSILAAETMLSAYEEKISSIVLIAGQFSKMIGVVVSGDFEVMVVSPGKEFDAVTMEEDTDGGSDTEVAAGQTVLCSTHLGLTKRMPLESGEKNTLTVMKPKVLFESFLDVPSD